VAVVLISSELPEVIGLSHRVVVMQRGVVTGTLSGDDLTEETVMAYATGLRSDRRVAETRTPEAHVGL
jgi:ribose transport system ATP-binding protein